MHVVAFFNQDRLNGAGLMGIDFRFHFHGFHNENGIALINRIPFLAYPLAALGAGAGAGAAAGVVVGDALTAPPVETSTV